MKTYTFSVRNRWMRVRTVLEGENDPDPPEFVVNFEESTDQNAWSTCENTTADEEIDPNDEQQFRPLLRKRWFRIRVTLAGTGIAVTCWCVGFLEMRVR